jgi:hypothetical protein
MPTLWAYFNMLLDIYHKTVSSYEDVSSYNYYKHWTLLQHNFEPKPDKILSYDDLIEVENDWIREFFDSKRTLGQLDIPISTKSCPKRLENKCLTVVSARTSTFSQNSDYTITGLDIFYFDVVAFFDEESEPCSDMLECDE